MAHPAPKSGREFAAEVCKLHRSNSTLRVQRIPKTMPLSEVYELLFGEPASLMNGPLHCNYTVLRTFAEHAIFFPPPRRIEVAAELAGVRPIRYQLRRVRLYSIGSFLYQCALIEFSYPLMAATVMVEMRARASRIAQLHNFTVESTGYSIDLSDTSDYNPETERPCTFGLSEDEIFYLETAFDVRAISLPLFW